MQLDRTIQVLLIEDNSAEARFLREILKGNRSREFRLIHVQRLSDAIEALQQDNFDAILLDLTLPDSQGLDSLDPLLEIAPNIPIVVLTNTNDDRLALEAVRRGAQDYLIKKEITLELLSRSLCYAIERKQTEEALRARVLESNTRLKKEREINQQKSEFVSMLSHDFRNPLNKILLSAGLLEESRDRLTKEQQVNYFRMIRSAIKDMDQLLTEVLLLGRVDAGGLSVQFDEVDLLQFCRQFADSLAIKTENRSPLHFSIEGVLERGLWDVNLIKHILTNILENAFKYSPDATPVDFRVKVESDRVIFQVEDRGIGIPESDRPRLFQPFYRGENVEGIQGTGLGLAIVARCVEAHRGEIAIDTREGIGTIVTVTLPIFTELE